MPVTSVTQNEEVDPAGNVTFTYAATVTLDSPPSTFTVTVEGGADWADRLIAAIQAEAAKFGAVGALGV